jgi:hypothetical protein
LFGATSKECGKMIKDRISLEPEKKTSVEQNTEKGKISPEFSLINTIFFQTT